MASKREGWLSLLPGDPRPVLLASDEPFARFVTLTAVLGQPEDDAQVRRARKAVVDDPRVCGLLRVFSAIADVREAPSSPRPGARARRSDSG